MTKPKSDNNSSKCGGFLLSFFSALDTPGGHIAICLGLLIGYGHMTGTGLGHDIAIFAMGVLSRSMGTKKDSGEYAPAPSSSQIVKTEKTEV